MPVRGYRKLRRNKWRVEYGDSLTVDYTMRSRTRFHTVPQNDRGNQNTLPDKNRETDFRARVLWSGRFVAFPGNEDHRYAMPLASLGLLERDLPHRNAKSFRVARGHRLWRELKDLLQV